MAKDFTKFRIKGTETWLPKNRLVLSCLQQFFKDVIVGDYNYLKKTWSDEIQGGAGIIIALEEVTNERYYFMDNVLEAPDGKKYVVCNQWGTSNFEKFIELAKTMGYPIESNESETSNQSNLKEDTNPTENTETTKEQTLKISVFGTMSQIFQNKKEEDESIEDIENHYDNILSWFFKIDADNLMIVELDGEKIFENSISELGIHSDDLDTIWDADDDLKKKMAPKLAAIKSKKHFADIDTDEILISSKNHTLVINEGGLDYGLDLEQASDFENRYTYEEYGKYHIETLPVKVSNFKMSDLFFQKDTNIEDLLGAGGEPYIFSKIHHYELGELEFEINANNVKSSDLYEGWAYDV
jgi:hypothetical protein